MSLRPDVTKVVVRTEGMQDMPVNAFCTVHFRDGKIEEYSSIDQESIRDESNTPVAEYDPQLAEFLTNLAERPYHSSMWSEYADDEGVVEAMYNGQGKLTSVLAADGKWEKPIDASMGASTSEPTLDEYVYAALEKLEMITNEEDFVKQPAPDEPTELNMAVADRMIFEATDILERACIKFRKSDSKKCTKIESVIQSINATKWFKIKPKAAMTALSKVRSLLSTVLN